MPNISITKTVFFNASPAIVWTYLTEKEKLGKWFHPAEKDLEEGKDYALVAMADDGALVPQCWGVVKKMNPPTELVWSFTVKPMNGVMTTVTWTLEECAGGTKLTLVHSGLPGTPDDFGLVKALDAGWDMHLGRFRSELD
ncbi:MAG: SRPBCC domain-containing protein [Sneathiella sp.]